MSSFFKEKIRSSWYEVFPLETSPDVLPISQLGQITVFCRKVKEITQFKDTQKVAKPRSTGLYARDF